MKLRLSFTQYVPGVAVLLLTFFVTQPVVAQSPSPQVQIASAQVTERVYTCVEQMPQLPGGGGNAAIVTAILRGLTASKKDQTGGGSATAEFIVTTSGTIRNARVLHAPSPALEQALLNALQKVPRFEPGKQDGRTVPVQLAIRINCIKLQ